MMDQTTASFTEQGLCFHYFAERPSWYPDPCINYCKNHGGHRYDGCNVTSYENFDFENGDKSIISTDDNGFRWVPAPCECSNPDVEKVATSLLDTVTQGLERTDTINCAMWHKVFNQILESGMKSVYGKELLNVAGQAIQGAKTFAENGLQAVNFFEDWVGQTCGVPYWDDNLWTALLGEPDSLGRSVGCLRKDKSECLRQNPAPAMSYTSQAGKHARIAWTTIILVLLAMIWT
ncbi:hypothetical protein KCU83_g1508, partial [Aureobasidium melanogenum]